MQSSKIIILYLKTFIAIVFLTSIIQAQQTVGNRIKEKTNLLGHIVASINSITFGSWHPKYQSFLFVAEEKSNQKSAPKPIRILYEFFNKDNYLKKDFFDYSKLYKLKVVRKTDCDERLKDFGYETLVEDNDGKQIKTKISILRVLDGVNKNLFDENEVLPCYSLQETDYSLEKNN